MKNGKNQNGSISANKKGSLKFSRAHIFDKRAIPFEVVKKIQMLTPLTSSTATFTVNEKHKQAFDKN